MSLRRFELSFFGIIRFDAEIMPLYKTSLRIAFYLVDYRVLNMVALSMFMRRKRGVQLSPPGILIYICGFW